MPADDTHGRGVRHPRATVDRPQDAPRWIVGGIPRVDRSTLGREWPILDARGELSRCEYLAHPVYVTRAEVLGVLASSGEKTNPAHLDDAVNPPRRVERHARADY